MQMVLEDRCSVILSPIYIHRAQNCPRVVRLLRLQSACHFRGWWLRGQLWGKAFQEQWQDLKREVWTVALLWRKLSLQAIWGRYSVRLRRLPTQSVWDFPELFFSSPVQLLPGEQSGWVRTSSRVCCIMVAESNSLLLPTTQNYFQSWLSQLQ